MDVVYTVRHHFDLGGVYFADAFYSPSARPRLPLFGGLYVKASICLLSY
jgi:hypothetical protein